MPEHEIILDDGDSVKEDAVITGGGELVQNKTTSEKCGTRPICYLYEEKQTKLKCLRKFSSSHVHRKRFVGKVLKQFLLCFAFFT
jgi:hypothetical protein